MCVCVWDEATVEHWWKDECPANWSSNDWSSNLIRSYWDYLFSRLETPLSCSTTERKGLMAFCLKVAVKVERFPPGGDFGLLATPSCSISLLLLTALSSLNTRILLVLWQRLDAICWSATRCRALHCQWNLLPHPHLVLLVSEKTHSSPVRLLTLTFAGSDSPAYSGDDEQLKELLTEQ